MAEKFLDEPGLMYCRVTEEVLEVPVHCIIEYSARRGSGGSVRLYSARGGSGGSGPLCL